MGDIALKTAKVLILGDSGVGKSCLFHRLQGDTFDFTESTHGASLSHISFPHQRFDQDRFSFICELELWDLGGQPDYNVFHQIFMQGAEVALIVIDEFQRDVFSSINYWLNLVEKHCPDLHAIILVSSRVDLGILHSETSIAEHAKALGFSGFFRTSAKTGDGINLLRDTLINVINWPQLSQTIMPGRWRSLLIAIRELGCKALPIAPITDIPSLLKDKTFTIEEIRTLLMVMHTHGEVFVWQPRSDTELVLLQPDALNYYANSIVLAARTNTQSIGIVDEIAVLRANIDLMGLKRLPAGEERLLLDSVVTLLIDTGACYRENGKLVFPSQSNRPMIKCFLSHNSADKPIAEQLAKRLLDSGIDVWLDKWEILAGESLTSKIEEGIDKANAFIILMSPNSMKAKWVKEELRIAIQRRIEDLEFSLIPILLQDCEIPSFLKDYVYVDWRLPKEETFEFLLNSLRGLKSKP